MSQHLDPAFCAALGKQRIDAWNSHDLERILALYSDDSEMTSDKIPLLGLDPRARCAARTGCGNTGARGSSSCPTCSSR